MDNQVIYDKLTELTEGLLYISETENEFSVYEVEPGEADNINALMEEIAGMPAASFREEPYELFFEKLLAGLSADDPAMQDLKKRYEELFAYLQAAFKSIRVLVAGDVEQHIFIIGSTEEQAHFLLYTASVES